MNMFKIKSKNNNQSTVTDPKILFDLQVDLLDTFNLISDLEKVEQNTNFNNISFSEFMKLLENSCKTNDAYANEKQIQTAKNVLTSITKYISDQKENGKFSALDQELSAENTKQILQNAILSIATKSDIQPLQKFSIKTLSSSKENLANFFEELATRHAFLKTASFIANQELSNMVLENYHSTLAGHNPVFSDSDIQKFENILTEFDQKRINLYRQIVHYKNKLQDNQEFVEQILRQKKFDFEDSNEFENEI